MIAKPRISMKVGSTEFVAWQQYTIDSDLLTPADAFSLRFPNHGGAMAGKVKCFDQVQVLVDGVLQMTGYVDEVAYSSNSREGAFVEVTGRDAFGQLADVSAEPKTYHGVTLLQLATLLASNWVPSWDVHNELNRTRLLVARRKLATLRKAAGRLQGTAAATASTTEADSIEEMQRRAALNLAAVRRRVYHKVKVEPGESIYDVLQREATKANLLLWMAADGRGVMATPNYTQAPVFRLWNRSDADARLNNITSANVIQSGREVYGTYRALAYSGNTSSLFGSGSRHRSEVTDSDAPSERLLVYQEDAHTTGELKDRNVREKNRRAFERQRLEYEVRGHYNSGLPWQVDTLCQVDDQINGVQGAYYVVGRRFVANEQGQSTVVTLHPKDLLLA